MRSEVAELLASIDGLPGLVSTLLLDVLAELQSDEIAEGADIRSLLPSTLERMADRMRGSPPRHNAGSAQPRAMVELVPSADSSVRWPATRAGTILRLGALELDLIDRTAKRGDRQIDLRPREFLLLKYMMQRSDKLLTRATLLKEVWHYKFVPETNLVDVHLGRLRRKVDGANEAPMIRNIRGVGFVMSASLPSQGSPPNRAERSTALPPETSFRSGSKGLCSDYQ
jgi:DNA-binding winged helix-turn-helix (wHTH) protein